MATIPLCQITGSWDADAKATAQALVWGLQQCQPRVLVTKFKSGWGKNMWAPPEEVEYDVLKTNSLKWPYQIVISYTVQMGGTKSHKKREDAEQDVTPIMVLKGKYKNTYQMGDDGSLRLSETLVQGIDGGWKERPRWPDVCWDHLPKPE